MATIQGKFSYTDRDFEKIRQRCIQLIQATSPINEKWTDFNEASIDMALIELLSAIGDELAHAQDMMALEAFLSTARQRRSISYLGKLIGYKLDPAVSAEGIVTFRWIPQTGLDYPTVPIHLPKYTRLETAGPEVVPFVTIDGATLPAGSTSVEVRIRQGVLFEEEFQATGDPYQEYTLSRNDIASNFGAVEILVGQGDDLSQYVEWEEAESFLINSPEDNQKRFVVETNHLDQVTVKFGDGKFGAIPQDGFTIVARYLSSLGAEGNVGAHKVNNVIDQLRDADTIAVTLQVTNNEACVGGADRETIEHARRQAPQELSALHRMVTRFDADALINGLAGVGKAKVWGEHEVPHPDIKHFNQMYVTFVAEGIKPEIGDPESWLPTRALKDLILEFVEDKKVVTTQVVFVEPEVIFVDVQLDVYIATTASPVTVKQTILDALEEFFALPEQDFAEDLRYSNLIKVLDSIPNVEYVKLKLKRNGTPPPPRTGADPIGSDPDPHSSQWSFDEQDIIARRNEFCQLGNISASDGTQNFIHFRRDEEPIRASFVVSPAYQLTGQPVTFDGTSSSSPLGEIVKYEWNMGSRGQLLVQLPTGQYVPASVQPSDNQSFFTNFDGSGKLYQSVIWKYTTKPSSGRAIVVLTVSDAFGGVASYAMPFEVR